MLFPKDIWVSGAPIARDGVDPNRKYVIFTVTCGWAASSEKGRLDDAACLLYVIRISNCWLNDPLSFSRRLRAFWESCDVHIRGMTEQDVLPDRDKVGGNARGPRWIGDGRGQQTRNMRRQRGAGWLTTPLRHVALSSQASVNGWKRGHVPRV